MKRHPFDHLREANPLPEDRPVYPPLGTADRIVGATGRRSWPAWALAGGLALAVLVGGGAWLLWARGGVREIAATSAPPTTAAGTTAPIGEPPTGDAVVYFFVEDDGTQSGDGPYLIPVARSLAVLSHFVTDPVHETLNFLLGGTYPGEEEADPPLFSAIPEGTRLLGLEVSGGVATVDLSSGFFSGNADGVRRRCGQVVFTLTRFENINGVLFRDEGLPFADWGDNAPAGDPVTGLAFADLLPPVLIESPAYWATTGNGPLVVHGLSAAGVVGLELLDQGRAVLWEGAALTASGPDWLGDFSVEIPYQVNEGQQGTLVAWEAAEDGSRTNVRQHPVWLNATTAGEQTTTTLDPVAEQLALRYDLDKAVDDTLAQIEAIDAQLTGLPLDQGIDLRTRAAELDRYLAEELRPGLSRVFDELQALDADFAIPCSAEGLAPALVASPLPGQPALPVEVAALQSAIYEAARSCDWAALADLLDPATFSYSFGEGGDPIAYWQRAEFLHYEPMLYIAGMLQRPYGVIEADEAAVYTWPSAQAYGSWAEVPEAEREALRPLYDDADLASFAESGGYLGFRVGISFDGGAARWVYAIEGD